MEPHIVLLLIIASAIGAGVGAWKINKVFDSPPNSLWSVIAGGFAAWFAAFAVASHNSPESANATIFFVVSSASLTIGIFYSNYKKTEDTSIAAICLPIQLIIGFIVLPWVFIFFKKIGEILNGD